MWRSTVLSLSACCALTVGAANAATTDEKLDALSSEVERLRAEVEKQKAAPAQAASATTLGGYGEMHYNNLTSTKQLDFQRFVLFLGHRFNDRVRFQSELELEHSFVEGGEASGEIELEQAYLNFDLTDTLSSKAGLFLIPAGILNETHEPPTFYGVERNPVETDIIPTTWWEGGVGLSGRASQGFGYDLALTSGLKTPTTTANAFSVRKGRQKVSKADAHEGALTARVKWTGVPGVEWAATAFYQPDIAQSPSTNNPATLLETHVIVNKGPIGLRALYAQWRIGGDGPAAGASPGRNKQYGWYVEPSYKLTPKLGVFARYAVWDTNAGAPGNRRDQTNVGFNYWPIENVVFKADVQRQGRNGDDNGYNLGLGYMF